jgi:hypothetical protein
MDDDTIPIPEAAFLLRSSYDVEAFFDGEEPDGAGPVERARRQRKPNVDKLHDKLIAKAKAAGATRVVVEGVEMHFGNAASGNGAATDVDRELAEFEARHEA